MTIATNIQNQRHYILIDTGSAMTIVNTNKLDMTPYPVLDTRQVEIKTINSTITQSTNIIQFPVPKEFGYSNNTFIKAYAQSLENKNYTILLGMDVLKNIVKTIDPCSIKER